MLVNPNTALPPCSVLPQHCQSFLIALGPGKGDKKDTTGINGHILGFHIPNSLEARAGVREPNGLFFKFSKVWLQRAGTKPGGLGG